MCPYSIGESIVIEQIRILHFYLFRKGTLCDSFSYIMITPLSKGRNRKNIKWIFMPWCSCEIKRLDFSLKVDNLQLIITSKS